jgi:hypothetical protein
VIGTKYVIILVAVTLLTRLVTGAFGQEIEYGHIEIFCFFEGDGLAWNIDVWGDNYPATPPIQCHSTYNPTVWEPAAGCDYEIWATRRSTFEGDQWEMESTHPVILNAQPWPARSVVYPLFEYLGD